MRKTALSALLFPALALAFPPGSPMSDFGPAQVALGLFFDHSGQDLFQEPQPSVLNTAGLSLDYAPWPFLALGLFAGGAEFDIDVADGMEDDTSKLGYNTGFSFHGGGSLKLATPRFASGTTRLVAYGSAGYLDAEDDFGNRKRGIMTNSGANVQVMAWRRVNLVLGAEFQAILEGEQTSAADGTPIPMGMSEPSGPLDYMRGVFGVEYFFKGKNQPFLSVAIRPSGATDRHEHLGLRNASVSITLGAIATLPGKNAGQAQEEEPGMVEE